MFSKYSWKSSQFNMPLFKSRFQIHLRLAACVFKWEGNSHAWIRCKCRRIDFVHAKYRKVIVKNVLFITEGGEEGYANPPIHYNLLIYWPNPPLLPASEIRAKTLLLPAKSKIRAQKMAESAIRWNYRIRESVKISLWIRNPGKNISKICRSVHLFTPLITNADLNL